MLVAGIGAAVGAFIAASLPRSDTENKPLGGEADKLKDKALDAAAQGLEKGQKLAANIVDDVAQAAAREGVDGAGIERAVQDVTSRVKAVAERGVRTAVGESPPESSNRPTSSRSSRDDRHHFHLFQEQSRSQAKEMARDLRDKAAGLTDDVKLTAKDQAAQLGDAAKDLAADAADKVQSKMQQAAAEQKSAEPTLSVQLHMLPNEPLGNSMMRCRQPRAICGKPPSKSKTLPMSCDSAMFATWSARWKILLDDSGVVFWWGDDPRLCGPAVPQEFSTIRTVRV